MTGNAGNTPILSPSPDSVPRNLFFRLAECDSFPGGTCAIMNPREKNEGVSAAETVLYADVLFLINFSMDFLSLYAAGAFLSLRRSVGRMSAAAAIGAVYAVAVTAQQIGGIAGAAGALLISALMTLIAFGKGESLRGFFRTAAAVWGCGALLGGFMTLFSGLFGGTLPGGGAADLFFAGAAALLGFGRLLRGRIGRGFAEISVPYGENICECRALIDSGNLLRDPISALPVILICAEEARRFAGDETDSRFRGVPQTDASMRGGVRVVPRRCGDETKLLYGFLCPAVQIRRGGKCISRRAVICIDHDTDNYAGCGALLPASLL